MVERKAAVYNRTRNIAEEIPTSDTLTNVGATLGSITDDTTTVSDALGIDAKTNVKAKEVSTSEAILAFTASGGSLFREVFPEVRSNETTPDEQIDIAPFWVQLPDYTNVKQSSNVTLDLTDNTNLDLREITATASQTSFDFGLRDHYEIGLMKAFKNSTELTDFCRILLHGDNNSNDSSLGGLNPTVGAGVSYDGSDKKLGTHSISFSGSGAGLNFGNLEGFTLEQQFSIECWVKTSGTGNFYICGKTDSASSYQGFYLYVDRTNQRLLTYFVGSVSYNIGKYTSNSSLLNGQWNHVAMTYDGSADTSGILLYINGSLVTQLSTTRTFLHEKIQNDNDFTVGELDGTLFAAGKIDEFVLYPKTLTQTEITARYNSGAGSVFVPEFGISSTTKNLILPSGATVSDVYKLRMNPTPDSWGYVYATDDSNYSTDKCFLSSSRPAFRGHHRFLNAQCIGVFRIDGDGDIIFFKYKNGDYITASSYISYTTTSSTTALVEVSARRFVPPESNTYWGYNYLNSSLNVRGYIYGVDSVGSSRGFYIQDCHSYRYHIGCVKMSNNRTIWTANSGNGYPQFTYCNGFMFDPKNPLQTLV